MYPEKLPFKGKKEIKTFSDQQWREFVTRRPVLQEMLKKISSERRKEYRSQIWIFIKKGTVLHKA